MRALWTAVLGVSLLGCGGLSYEVDRNLLRDVSVENKLLLFDAENDVSIALDEQEMQQRKIRETRTQIRAMDTLEREAEADLDRAKAKKDPKAVDTASMSLDVLALKREYLEAHVDALREKLSAQDVLVRVALAKYELAKAKLVKKNNVRGADKIDLKDFEEQVDDIVASARDAQSDVAEAEKEAAQKRQAWLAARAKLEKTGAGGAGSPWADDATAWGAP
jgi:hypothetical protein